MKKGKQLGEYTSKFTSWRVKEDGEIEINVEGNIEGIGYGFSTLTLTAGKTGEYEWNGVSYAAKGDIGTAGGEDGKFESIGVNRWATSGLIKASDGRTMLEEGIFDLAARTWNGKYYEATK